MKILLSLLDFHLERADIDLFSGKSSQTTYPISLKAPWTDSQLTNKTNDKDDGKEERKTLEQIRHSYSHQFKRFMCANLAILSDFQIEIIFIILGVNRHIWVFDIFS